MILRGTPSEKLENGKKLRQVGANPDMPSRKREGRWGKVGWGKRTTCKINHLAKARARAV